MRRALNAASAYLADLRRSVARGWAGFFFAPADPRPLGLMRIAVGLLLFWSLATMAPDLRANLGSHGWAEPDVVRQYYYGAPEPPAEPGHDPDHNHPGGGEGRSPWAWSFWFLVPDALLPVAWGACLVVLAGFALGFQSRITAPLAWAIAVSTARRMPVLLFGFDNIVATWALYLAVCGASGQAFSLDRWLARRRGAPAGPPAPTVSANLGLRLIQLHLCLIYGAAGLAKLRAPQWWDGSALEMILLISEFRRFDLTWLIAYPGFLAVATHGALALEVAYPVLVWVRPLRPLLLVGAIAMHVSIDLTLGLTEFGLAMIAGNLAFLPPGAPRRETDTLSARGD